MIIWDSDGVFNFNKNVAILISCCCFIIVAAVIFLGVGAPWGTPVYKGWGCSSEILKRTPKRYHDPVLWAWLEMFSSLRGT